MNTSDLIIAYLLKENKELKEHIRIAEFDKDQLQRILRHLFAHSRTRRICCSYETPSERRCAECNYIYSSSLLKVLTNGLSRSHYKEITSKLDAEAVVELYQRLVKLWDS